MTDTTDLIQDILSAQARLAVVRRDLAAIEFLWCVRIDGDSDAQEHQRLTAEAANWVAWIDLLRDKLCEAAVGKRTNHESRKAWWEKKKAEVMQKVRDTGIEVRDSVAASYSSTKGNYGPQIEINEGLQRDLSECQQKIREHDDLMRSYDGWVQVLSAHPESRLTLDHEDFLFFYGS